MRLLAIVVFTTLAVAACSQEPTENTAPTTIPGEAAANEAEALEAGESTAESEPEATPVAILGESEFTWDEIEDVSFALEGEDLLVAFPGFPGDPHIDPCSTRFEITDDDSEVGLTVSVFELVAVDPPFPGLTCRAGAGTIVQSVPLPEPLGDRTLRSAGREVSTVLASDLRQPTFVPFGWERSVSEATDRQFNDVAGGVLQFGPIQLTVERTDGSDGGSVIATIEGNPTHEVIDILSEGDGRIITRGNGVHRIGFLDGDWSYDLLSEAEVVREELIAFAQSFERQEFGFLRQPIVAEHFTHSGNQINIEIPQLVTDPASSHCNSENIEVITDETPEQVTITIFAPVPRDSRVCSERNSLTSIISTQLVDPIGDRILISNGRQRSVPADDGSDVRSPTFIPTGWESVESDFERSQGNFRFGPTNVRIRRSDMFRRSRVEQIEEESPEHQVVDILRAGDGRLLLRDSGTLVVAFTDGAWQYALSANGNPDVGQLLEFARSFEPMEVEQ